MSWAALGLFVVAGCQSDEIERYQVPREMNSSTRARPTRLEVRMLAAIIPQKDRTWFLKMVGLAKEINSHEADFNRFVRSVRFTGQIDRPITWRIPSGWKGEPGPGMRYATFQFGKKKKELKLTVVPLGKEAGSVLENINRWRKEIALKDIDETDLPKVARTTKVGDLDIIMVDMTNSDFGRRMHNPPSMDREMPKRPVLSPPTYEVPQGWEKLPKPGAIRLVAFRVTRNGKVGIAAITPLFGTAGGLVKNVNRWRVEKVGLDEADEAAIKKDLGKIRVDGMNAPYADLIGPKASGGLRFLGVILMRNGYTWFFTLEGPADVVGQHKAAFESFVKSIRFGGKGADDE